MSQPLNPTGSARLDGWKAIARYLSRDRTTVMRWAATRGLPVHSLPGGKRASVYAIGAELDAWMVSGEEEKDPHPNINAKVGRRDLLAGAVAVSAAGIAGIAILQRHRSRISPSNQSLMQQARLLLHQNTRDTQNQAIALYREVVRSAPRNGDAWGMLGYANAVASHWRERAESATLREQAKMDGQSALDLEPESALGQLALAVALPYLGINDWQARDSGLRRAFHLRPDDPEIPFALGFILRFTGHLNEAAAMCERINPLFRTPIIYNVWIRALWSAGRTGEMERMLAKASSLYPNHQTLWQTKLEILMFSGRADEAVQIVSDAQGRPSNVVASDLDSIIALADSLRTGDPNRTDSFIRREQQNARAGVRHAINAIRVASLSGRLDQAFALADAYYFARGFQVGDNVGHGLFSTPDQRHTNFLFEPPAAAMRGDPRFAKLTEELGLERFWRESGRAPDYRRS